MELVVISWTMRYKRDGEIITTGLAANQTKIRANYMKHASLQTGQSNDNCTWFWNEFGGKLQQQYLQRRHQLSLLTVWILCIKASAQLLNLSVQTLPCSLFVKPIIPKPKQVTFSCLESNFGPSNKFNSRQFKLNMPRVNLTPKNVRWGKMYALIHTSSYVLRLACKQTK